MKTSIDPTSAQVLEIAQFDNDFVPASGFDFNSLMKLRHEVTRRTGAVICIDYEETYLHPAENSKEKFQKFSNKEPIKGLFHAVMTGIRWANAQKR